MKLNLSGNQTIVDVTEELVAQALRDLPFGGNSFVILTANEEFQQFIQTRPDGPRTFQVEWYDRTVPRALQANGVTKLNVLDLFRAYFHKDSVGLALIQWKDITKAYLELLATAPVRSTPSMDKDVTNLIERLELFEERVGVSLEGLYCAWNGSTLILTGELHPREGLTLKQDIELVATAYDDAGRIMDTDDRHYFAAKFYGFEAFKKIMFLAKLPTKIRVYPKAWL